MKLNLIALAAVVALLLLMTGCTGTEPTKSETPLNGGDEIASMIEDLDFLYDTLEKSHKDLYAMVSKETLMAEKERIVKEIPNMTDAEFYFSLKQLIAQVKDPHTTVNYSDSVYKHLMAMPFAIEKYGEDWHIMMLDEYNEKYLGSKLIAINDMPIETIFEKAKAIISFENEAWATSQFSNTIAFAEALNYLGVVEEDANILLKVETLEGLEVTFPLAPLTASTLMSTEIEVFEGETVAKTFPEGIYRALSLDEATLFIQYNVCQESPDLPMATFVETIKKELMDKPYATVVFDLRYNTGGDAEVIRPMLDMIKALKDEKALEIYTLIGKNTFSSAIINAIQTKEELGSTFIGTATGGTVNGFGSMSAFDLKNHPFVVTYSTAYLELIEGYNKDALYPDVVVVQTLEDYIDGIDTEIKWLLNK